MDASWTIEELWQNDKHHPPPVPVAITHNHHYSHQDHSAHHRHRKQSIDSIIGTKGETIIQTIPDEQSKTHTQIKKQEQNIKKNFLPSTTRDVRE